VWGGACEQLKALGHDVIWAGNWSEDPGDEEILAHVHREERILVTLDKDFGELAIVHGTPHSGIVRLVGVMARQQASVCQQVLVLHGRDLPLGGIVTAEPGRLRIRPAQPDRL
jgi:predicted nuclease of predicted toxin-antitoxin system